MIQHAAVREEQGCIDGVTEARGAPDDGLEDRLGVGLRLRDRTENLARGGLLLERAGELAIARPQLREQADVLDRDDRLVREGLQHFDLLRQKGSRDIPRETEGADRLPFAQQRHAQLAPGAPLTRRGRGEFGGRLKIGNVNDHAIQERLAGRGIAFGATWVRQREPIHRVGRHGVMAGDLQHLSVEAEDDGGDATAERHRVPRDRVEHGLNVGGRARDHAEDLAGRGLSRQRTGKVTVALLQLGEQPDVLDRDDGLVGEGLKQLDFHVREAPGRRAGDIDRPDRLALVQHRNRDDAPETKPSARPPHELDHGFVFAIRNVNHRPGQDRDAGRALHVERTRVLGANAREQLG